MDQWAKYQELVLSELKRLSKQQVAMQKTLDELKEKTTVLWVKAGATFGVAAYILSIATMYLIKK